MRDEVGNPAVREGRTGLPPCELTYDPPCGLTSTGLRRNLAVLELWGRSSRGIDMK